jgi:sterol desaturase/sphingolipid hydroxylase (fatty acid hydroxylase superfamily)
MCIVCTYDYDLNLNSNVRTRRDNMVILQTLVAAVAMGSAAFPAVSELRAWDPRGWALALLLHMAVSEPVFYWTHRALHRGPLFSQYHARHHSSPVTQPFTGTSTRATATLQTREIFFSSLFFFELSGYKNRSRWC